MPSNRTGSVSSWFELTTMQTAALVCATVLTFAAVWDIYCPWEIFNPPQTGFFIDRPVERPKPKPSPIPRPVVLARKRIQHHTIIEEDDLYIVQAWPKGVPRMPCVSTVADAVGKMALDTIYWTEPIARARIADAATAPLAVRANLGETERGLPLLVPPVDGDGRVLVPGNRVDVCRRSAAELDRLFVDVPVLATAGSTTDGMVMVRLPSQACERFMVTVDARTITLRLHEVTSR